MRKTLFASAALAICVAGCATKNTRDIYSAIPHGGKPGYTDTPMLPGGKWHVHDPERPVPPVVTPAATFSLGAQAPSDATVLFDGTDLVNWTSDHGDAAWTVESGYMEVVPKSGSIRTRDDFGDFQLHLEWAEPAQVVGDSQRRGNSGVIIYGRYEIQVLDSYQNPTYPDGQCGALYGQSPPLVNACKKPGEWQSYDIIFQGPRWDESKQLTRHASVTVIQNGVLIHNHQELIGKTEHRGYGKDDEKPQSEKGPIVLQEHGNPVRYRNIWIRNITEEEKP